MDAGFAVFTVVAKPRPPPVLKWGFPYVAAYLTSTPCMIPPFGTLFPVGRGSKKILYKKKLIIDSSFFGSPLKLYFKSSDSSKAMHHL